MVGDWPGSSHKLATLDRLVDEEPVVPLAVVANHIALHAACPAHLLILANAVRCRSMTRSKIKAGEKKRMRRLLQSTECSALAGAVTAAFGALLVAQAGPAHAAVARPVGLDAQSF